MTDSADPVVADPARFDPARPPPRELETSIGDGFVLCAAGDCIVSRPLTQTAPADPGFAQVLDILAGGTAVVGNLETVALDIRSFAGHPHSFDGDWPLVCEPAAVTDLARMGFTLMGRANNHALDWGVEGMRECGRHLDAAGIAHAGCGETAGLARRARYAETPLGRVGLVSCTSTFPPAGKALDQRGAAPGRPGVSGLAISRTTAVPPALLPKVTALAGELAALGVAEAIGPFDVADAAGYRYAVDAGDLAAVLRQVRQGKQHADLLVFALHAHEPAGDAVGRAPDDFAALLARAAVDAGADVVLTTGIHALGPIELHRGRPIFHGLGDFIWSDVQEPLPDDVYGGNSARLGAAFEHPERATDADLTLLLAHPDFSGPEAFQGVVPRIAYAGGRPTQVRLYPVDLGHGERLTRSGTPRLAPAAAARAILERLSECSAAYGTEIGRLRERGTEIGVVDM